MNLTSTHRLSSLSFMESNENENCISNDSAKWTLSIHKLSFWIRKWRKILFYFLLEIAHAIINFSCDKVKTNYFGCINYFSYKEIYLPNFKISNKKRGQNWYQVGKIVYGKKIGHICFNSLIAFKYKVKHFNKYEENYFVKLLY